MFSTAPPSSSRYTKFANYIGTGTLVAVVVLLAWLQYRWLSQLSAEEEGRRRVALVVAATNYSDFVSRGLESLVALAGEAPLSRTLDDSPLVAAVVAFDTSGSARILERSSRDWRPVHAAELQQRLGRPLWLEAQNGRNAGGIWTYPPAIMRCSQSCEVAVIDREALNSLLLAPGIERMFADLDDELRIAVTIAGGRRPAQLYPAPSPALRVESPDIAVSILDDGLVYGPEGTEWSLRIDHGGTSLQTAVDRSHVTNLLMSAAVLSLLALSVGLVVLNARRQTALAREQLFFVAGISHELRTPLAVIDSAADNMIHGTITEPADVREYGGMVRSEVRRLGAMIENVLRFAQSASNRHPGSSETIEIADLVQQTLERAATALEGMDVRLDVQPGMPTVVGDAAALQSALGNLIGNAARYATNGNWITVTARTVRVRPRGSAIRISVTNPVDAPPDAHPERLFEPFVRGSRVRDTGLSGAGIGLAVARNVARQHGGGITVDTGNRNRITFTLFLPVPGRSR